MLKQYLLPVQGSLVLFPVLAVAVLLPAAVLGYRVRGRAGGWPYLVFAAFAYYLLAAFTQTVMPLPRDPDAVCGRSYASHPNLTPFRFVGDTSRAAGGDWTLSGILHNMSFWTSLLNLALLLPLGVFLRYLFKRGFTVSVLIAFGVSLFFEVTQLTGLWGVYRCPYRLFNVDDLILNTLGAAIGWLVMVPLGRLLPVIDPAGDRARHQARVTFPRRLFALVTDVAFWLGLTAVGATVAALFDVGGHQGPRDAADLLPIGIAFGASYTIVFLVTPALTKTTLGKRAVLLRLEGTDGSPAGRVRILVRQVLLTSPVWCFIAVLLVPVGGSWRWAYLVALCGFLLTTLLGVTWFPLSVLLTERKLAPYEVLTGVRNGAVPRSSQHGSADARATSSSGSASRSTGVPVA